jgi:hypothetical protein
VGPVQRISAAEFRQSGLKGRAPDSRALGRLSKGQMNKTEERYAALLDADPEVVWWRFEAVKLMLAPNTSITVDFFVMTADRQLEAHDVKGSVGMITDDARAKMKIAAAMFPFVFKIVVPTARAGSLWAVEEVGRG